MATINAIGSNKPIEVAFGGTGAATLTGILTGNGTSAVTANAVTQHGVLIGGATNAISSLGVAATGSTLMGSTGADPAFTGSPSFSGSVTAGTGLTVTTGNATVTAGNLVLPATTSTAGQVTIGGSRFLHAAGSSSNTFVGIGSGNFTLTSPQNTMVGQTSGQALSSGLGTNTALGYGAGFAVNSGTYNIFLGALAGNSYTTESSNITLGYNNVGIAGESNCLRIGSSNSAGAGGLTKAYIQGISGVTVTGTAVLCATNGQLGTISSSRKYKENIQDMDDSATIYDLKAKNFTMKNDPTKHRQWGFIAEEVEQVNKNLVNYHYETGDVESIRYLDLIPMLVNELQKANKRIEMLEAR